MSSRYDSRTTIFSPQGRLYQVEYAMEAISQAGSAVGIRAVDGVVLAAEKRVTSTLLDTTKSSEKIFKLDDHVATAVAGITSDANILLNFCRLAAQRYTFQYQEPVPLEVLLQRICDVLQSYTQYGGLRPFGVALLFAGWDEQNGFQLLQSDPSGNFSGWKATAVGSNSEAAKALLKAEYEGEDKEDDDDEEDDAGEAKGMDLEEKKKDEDKDDMTLDRALKLALKTLAKTMDTTAPTAEKLEFSTITRTADGKIVQRMLSKEELEQLIKDTNLKKEGEEDGGDI